MVRQPDLPDAAPEAILPALAIMSAAFRARKTVARSRRLPGLSILFVGTARGQVKASGPPVPVLPWSVGLSPTLLWGPERPPVVSASSVVAPAGRDGAGSAPLAPATPRPLEAAGQGARAGDAGLEAVGPALILAGSMVGAPVRARAAAAEQPEVRTSVRRRGPGTGPSLDLAAARPAAGARPGAGERGDARGLGGAVDTRAVASGAPDAPRPGEAGIDRGAWQVVSRRVAARTTEDAADVGGARSTFAAGLAQPLRWATSSPHPAAIEPGSAGATAAAAPSSIEPVAPGEAPPVLVARTGMPFGERARPSADVAAPRLGTAHRLPQRDPRAAPAAIKDVSDVAESLRSLVAKEVQEVRDTVGRAVAAKRAEAPAQAALALTDDTARTLLRRMRSMIQEERFRSGKLR